MTDWMRGAMATRTSDLELRAIIAEARRTANEVLDRYAVSAPEHILLEEYAMEYGAEVVFGRLDGGLARLLRTEDGAVIRVSEDISNEGRRRFCVAHELGHFLLKHESPPIKGCTEMHQSQFGSHARLETQANVFAAELLLPESLVAPRCDVKKASLRVCREIADDFKTSVLSATLRFVELTPESCAAVFSVAGRIEWWAKSERFFGWLPNRGSDVDKWSMAGRYFRSGEGLADYPQSVDGESWCENIDGYVKEHSMAMPSINAVLTLLLNVDD